MATILFPAGVLGLAVTMLVAHARSWQRARERRLNAADLVFRHGQFRRRMQASSLLALVAPTMLVGARLSPDRSPRVFVVLWLMVLLATCWIAWLAIVDAVASSRHFHRIIRERSADRVRLKGELDRLMTEARAARTTADAAPSENGPNLGLVAENQPPSGDGQ
jgi:hypothetical protein